MIWLIGTGPMARDYARVFVKLGLQFVVIGLDQVRTETFAREFEASGLVAGVLHGGVEYAISSLLQKKIAAPSHAVVAAPIDVLSSIAALLAPHCPYILLEKPGALEASELAGLLKLPAVLGGTCAVYIGYNRRFFEPIAYLRRQIAKDGPILSAVLEFDEPVPRIEALPTDAAIKARWGYANASHVFDLLFYLCGRSADETRPRALSADPRVDWHPTGSVFVGAGCTMGGTRYVYHGNFASVGRWRLALSMRKRRFLLMPLETLQVVEGASVLLRDVALPTPDPDLKAGLRPQVEAFLAGDPERQMASLADQRWHLDHLASVFGYPK